MKVDSLFVYLTEKCNLRCGYCYFRHKDGVELSLHVLSDFLRTLKRRRLVPRVVEISGGEPLLCWPRLVKAIFLLKRSLPQSQVNVQTNGLLLSPEKIGFLRQQKVGLEVGIDGGLKVTTRWRRGMGVSGFRRLVHNILCAQRAGLSVHCTMTVHPQEVASMMEGFFFLREMGIHGIDVTPAAFMPWDKRTAAIFRNEYARIVRASVAGELYMGEDEGGWRADMFDLSLHASGDVLFGDVYLCLPPGLRRQYSVWSAAMEAWDLKARRFFIDAYAALRRGRGRKAQVHRAQVCDGFRIVNRIVGKDYMNVRQLIPLMRFLTRVHLSMAARRRKAPRNGRGGVL